MRKAVEQRAFAVEGKLENICFLKGNGTSDRNKNIIYPHMTEI
jgi:hypothetical protein